MKIDLLIFLIIIFIIIIFLIYFSSRHGSNKSYYIDRSEQTIIPKKIWTYWHDTNLPEIIQKFIENWKYHNPDYSIIILNNDNYKEYIVNCDITNIYNYPAARFYARIADFMRIHVINQHGGIWLDASTILHESLDWVLEKYNKSKYEFIGYNIVSKETMPQYPAIENWFLAAPKGSKFIQKWLERFLESNNFQSDYDYLLYIESVGVNLQNLSKTGYLTMHYAVQYVLQKEMTIEDIQTKLYLEKAEDGPFKYLHENSWDIINSIKDLCVNTKLKTKVIKFRKYDRKAIEDNKLFCVFNI